MSTKTISAIRLYSCLLIVCIRSSHISGSTSSRKANSKQLRGSVAQNSSDVVLDGYNLSPTLDGYLEGVDVCKNGPNSYERCNLNRFPVCAPGLRICMFRQPRTDLFFDRMHHDPAYYVDYDKIQCKLAWRFDLGRKNNCNKCDPGVWCESLSRCVKHKKRFCPDYCHEFIHKEKLRTWCPSRMKCLKPSEMCHD